MENQQKILDCALELFAARGYDAVGVQEIVDAAEVTKPTLYHYFGSKHGLLQTLFGIYFVQLNRLTQEACKYQGDLPLTLVHLVMILFSFARQYPTYYRLQLSLWFAPPDSEGYQTVEPYYQEQYHIVEEMFIQAANDHGNMLGRHQAYAATLLGMVHTYIGLSLNGHATLDEQLARQAVAQFMHGIYS